MEDSERKKGSRMMNQDQKETWEETQEADLDGVSVGSCSCSRALWQEVKVWPLRDPERQQDASDVVRSVRYNAVNTERKEGKKERESLESYFEEHFLL